MPKLLIESGNSTGNAFEFDDDVLIGRGSTPDFAIFDPSVSRKHASLHRQGKTYYLSDLGSGNGTALNGNRITGPTAVADGDRIRLGDVVVRFSLPEAPTEYDDGTLVLFREPGQTSKMQPVLDVIEADGAVATLLTGVEEKDSLEVARQRLQIVAEVSEAISDTLDEKPLLPLIMKKLFEVFPQAERGFIMLTEEGQDDLQVKVALTRSGEPAEFAVSRTLVRDAIDNRRGILTADAAGDDRYAATKTVLQLKLRSVVCVPMIARGDVFGIIHLDGSEKPFVKDDMAILVVIARQAAVSLSNARTHARLLKQRLVNEDLALARKIQSHFLPHQRPQATGYAFRDVYRSALEIGGDYYDFLSLPESLVGIAVGDVSGKGVSAALCMAKLSSEARHLSAGKTEPAAILRELNASLFRDLTEGMFVTLVFFSLDVANRRLRLANAGHPPPLLRHRDGRTEQMETKRSMPLGIAETVDFEESVFELAPGDTVIAFTDGLNEATNTHDELFGTERITRAVSESEGTPEKTLEVLLQSVETFQEDQPQSDDLTIVCFGPTANS